MGVEKNASSRLIYTVKLVLILRSALQKSANYEKTLISYASFFLYRYKLETNSSTKNTKGKGTCAVSPT